jgi:hypothetical protein
MVRRSSTGLDILFQFVPQDEIVSFMNGIPIPHQLKATIPESYLLNIPLAIFCIKSDKCFHLHYRAWPSSRPTTRAACTKTTRRRHG